MSPSDRVHRTASLPSQPSPLSPLALTVRNGGNVLVPCYPSGVIYDLLECLYQYIDSAGLSSVPFYFISPVANSSLEFSQIFAEWYVKFWGARDSCSGTV